MPDRHEGHGATRAVLLIDQVVMMAASLEVFVAAVSCGRGGSGLSESIGGRAAACCGCAGVAGEAGGIGGAAAPGLFPDERGSESNSPQIATKQNADVLFVRSAGHVTTPQGLRHGPSNMYPALTIPPVTVHLIILSVFGRSAFASSISFATWLALPLSARSWQVALLKPPGIMVDPMTKVRRALVVGHSDDLLLDVLGGGDGGLRDRDGDGGLRDRDGEGGGEGVGGLGEVLGGNRRASGAGYG